MTCVTFDKSIFFWSHSRALDYRFLRAILKDSHQTLSDWFYHPKIEELNPSPECLTTWITDSEDGYVREVLMSLKLCQVTRRGSGPSGLFQVIRLAFILWVLYDGTWLGVSTLFEFLAVISFRDFSASARLARPILRIRASTRQRFSFWMIDLCLFFIFRILLPFIYSIFSYGLRAGCRTK